MKVEIVRKPMPIEKIIVELSEQELNELRMFLEWAEYEGMRARCGGKNQRLQYFRDVFGQCSVK